MNHLLKCQHAPGTNLDSVFDTLAIDVPLSTGPVNGTVQAVASRRDRTLYGTCKFDLNPQLYYGSSRPLTIHRPRKPRPNLNLETIRRVQERLALVDVV